MGLTVRLPEGELTVEPGESVTCEVTLENTGRIVDQYTIQVLGDAAPWTSVEPVSVNLVPAAKGSVLVTFQPPRQPDVVAGTHPFRIVATSREDPATSTFATGRSPSPPSTRWRPTSDRSTARGSASYEAVVENRGNAPVVAHLVAVDERQMLELKVSEPVISVPPGSSGVTQVHAQPAAGPLPASRPPTRSA